MENCKWTCMINCTHTKILSHSLRGLQNAIKGQSKDLVTHSAARWLVSLCLFVNLLSLARGRSTHGTTLHVVDLARHRHHYSGIAGSFLSSWWNLLSSAASWWSSSSDFWAFFGHSSTIAFCHHKLQQLIKCGCQTYNLMDTIVSCDTTLLKITLILWYNAFNSEVH